MSDELKTIKFQLMLSPSEARAIDDWGFNNRIRTRAEAIRRLCQMALVFDPKLDALMMAGIEADKLRLSFSDEIVALYRGDEATDTKVLETLLERTPDILDSVRKISNLVLELTLASVPYRILSSVENADDYRKLLNSSLDELSNFSKNEKGLNSSMNTKELIEKLHSRIADKLLSNLNFEQAIEPDGNLPKGQKK